MRAVAPWLDTIGRVFQVIPDLATPEQVEAALRDILDDPALRVYWWDWEHERYVGVRGAAADPAAESAQEPGTATAWLGYESRRVGAIVHSARLLEDPEFAETFLPLLRIAMERDRLYRDLVAKLEQLSASRLRILQAGDDARRRFERNLHDGAQQRLTAALLGLRTLAAEVVGDPGLGPRAATILAELEGGIDDLRELSRGLDPPLLARHGLEAAIRAGAVRSSLPLELDLALPRRLPPPIEAAAYYVCAEAVTNTVKHARATHAWLGVVDDGSTLTVTVRDDGVGGACIECQEEASGLEGLVDRVETLGGTLALTSPEGAGTTLTAVIPLDPPG